MVRYTIHAGDVVSMNGSTGAIYVGSRPLQKPEGRGLRSLIPLGCAPMRRPNEEVCTGLADEGLGSPGSESDSWGAGYSGRMNLCAYFRQVGRMPAFGSIGLHGVATRCGCRVRPSFRRETRAGEAQV